jgi:hypothetical protein
MDTKQIIAGAYELLARADQERDASKALGAVILACGNLLEIVNDQRARIERLEDALQNHLETAPRRRHQ